MRRSNDLQEVLDEGTGVPRSRRRSWEEVPDPQLQADTDVDRRHRRGHDLRHRPAHPQGRRARGGARDDPGSRSGRHGRGGRGRRALGAAPGDHVLVSCISGCGTCRFCREGHYGQCLGGGGWALGHTIDGVQAEYARVPFADMSLYRCPRASPTRPPCCLADILPTSYEVGVLNGGVRPGDTVVIVGAGPIGLAAIMTAKLYSARLHRGHRPGRAAPRRRQAARAPTSSWTRSSETALEVVRSITGGLGADVVMEAVGIPATFEMCTELVRPGGRVANIGVHGAPATIHLETLWIKNVTITTGLVDTSTTPRLLRLLADHQLDPTRSSPTGSASSRSWRPTTSSAGRRRPAHSRSSCNVADSHGSAHSAASGREGES